MRMPRSKNREALIPSVLGLNQALELCFELLVAITGLVVSSRPISPQAYKLKDGDGLEAILDEI